MAKLVRDHFFVGVKPRPHQQQCRSNVRLEFVAKNGNNVNRVYRKILSLRQSRMLLRHCCRFWQQCRKKCRLFDKVETIIVERTKFRSTLLPKSATLLPKTATMPKQRSTLSKESFDLWHSSMLLRHCCWCGRGLSVSRTCLVSAMKSNLLLRGQASCTQFQ